MRMSSTSLMKAIPPRARGNLPLQRFASVLGNGEAGSRLPTFDLIRRLALATATLFLVPCLPAQDADSVFQSANRDFASANYEQAAAKYRGLVEKELTSPDLFFNLGTTLQRLGDPGGAVLWLRRTLVLDPTLPEARQSLEFLRQKIGFLEFASSPSQQFVRSLSPTALTLCFVLCAWMAAILAVAAFAFPPLRPVRSWCLVGTAVLAMIAFSLHRLHGFRESRFAPEAFATVTASGAAALTAPADDAKEVIDLPPGSEVRILQQTGAWVYADIPGELRGWIRATSIAPNWPAISPKPPAP